MSIKKTIIWKFFSSVRLAIWLLAIIAFLSLVGTFIPQNEGPEFYLDKFGHAGYNALLKTGLYNIYSSWWFILFLTLFSLNLAVCLANRFPFKRRSMGTIISHLSILIIFLGAFIGMVYGQKGLIKIGKGEEVSSFTSKGAKVDLGFSIRLDDFIYSEQIDRKERLLVYPAGKDTSHEAHDFSAPDKSQAPIAEVAAEVGKESQIADTGSKVKILRYLPDFVMDMSTKEAVNRSSAPNNPAIEVELKDKKGDIRRSWIFARFPNVHEEPGANFKFIYEWAERRPKDFISKVTILKGSKEILKKDIRVNEPLSFGGYKFFQSSFDTETLNWSGIQVVKDPGVGVVYTGFILLIAGFTIIFYVNPIIQRR